MKVALLLSGHVRKYIERYDNLRNNLINVLNPDIYIHTWNNIGLQNKGVGAVSVQNPNRKWINYESDFNDINQIVKLYKPTGLCVENDKELIDSFNIENKNVCIFIGQARDNATKYINSQLYSIYKSNEMKKSFEKKNNFKYDLVIRFRFDFDIKQPINPSILNQNLNNTIYIAHPIHSHHGHHMGGGGCVKCEQEVKSGSPRNHEEHSNDICDIIAYGNSESMDKYCSLFPNAWDVYSNASINNMNNIKRMNIKTEVNGRLTYVHGWDNIEKHVVCYYPERLLRHWLKSYTLINDNYIHGRIIR